MPQTNALSEATQYFKSNKGFARMLEKMKNKYTSFDRETPGNIIIDNPTKEEKDAIVSKYPKAEKLFKRIYGADEFINNRERWCLWLKDVSPVEYIISFLNAKSKPAQIILLKPSFDATTSAIVVAEPPNS